MQTHWLFVLAILISTVFCYGGSYYGSNNHQRVLLRNVDTLTFYNNKYTTGRRSSPIPQMTCTSGFATCRHAPPTIQCYNRGMDGLDVQWECKAQMENGYSLGRTEVSCEGYDYPEDPYILGGSCGINFDVQKDRTYVKNYGTTQSHSSGIFSFNFWIMIAFSIFFIYMVGLNTVLKMLFALLKVVFFPLYLPILCCRCCRGPAYATYIPSPPMFHNTFGEGWMWYHLGQEQGRREAYWDQNRYRSVPVYGPDDHYSSPSNDPSKHESTSYASTSRR
ncbi:hypothetical protein WA588_000377 [Blastocystis sp. NMH]